MLECEETDKKPFLTSQDTPRLTNLIFALKQKNMYEYPSILSYLKDEKISSPLYLLYTK